MDYRKLNSIIIRDAFPLPHIDEALQVVHNCNVFTSFDLAQGYLQLAMAEDDIKKTTFRAGSSGLYKFTHMPFGLSNAGSSFCRLMEQCLGDQQFVTLLLYLDDICIFALDVSTMLDQMELVFSWLKSFNLKIKPKKSYFFQASVIFLGHVLSANGISANPEKVEKVRDWPVPSNAKELHSFLGLASHYCQFIPNFACIAKCLHQLVGLTNVKKTKGKRKEVTTLEELKRLELIIPKFVWASEHQKAFDALKLALTTAPVLGYPDFKREFILETDASLRGLGAVLSQVDEQGKTHVIAYASWTLRPSQKSMCNYSSSKLELLALKWAVTEKFSDYLLGSKFTVYTDNNPLAYIQTSKLGVSQIRLLSKLALFDFNIIYRSGKSNQATDALSWHPEPNCKLESDDSDNDCNDPVVLSYATICDIIKPVLGDTKIPLTIKKKAQAASNLLEGEKSMPECCAILDLTAQTSAVSVFDQVPTATMAEAQLKDSVLGLVVPFIHKGVKSKVSVIAKIRCKAAGKYLLQFDRLVLKKGVLHCIYISNDVETHQLVLPLEYHNTVLRMLHDDYSHQGLDRTLALVRERFYWSTMNHDATEYVTNCHWCHVAKGHYTGPHTQQGSLVANNPLDLLCIDFLKVDPSRDGKKNILVLTDAFTKFSQAFITNNQKALTVAKVLVEKWFYVYGIPACIYSDKG